MVRGKGAPEGSRVHHVTAQNVTPMQSGPSFEQFDRQQTWHILDTCKAVASSYDKNITQVQRIFAKAFLPRQKTLSIVASRWPSAG